MKRSRHFRPITIGLIGASAFALAACKQDEEQATTFPDQKACIAESAKPGATVTEDQCTSAYAQAVQTNQQSAPRYDAMAACEEQHGAGNCQQAESSSGFGSVFLPIVTGFLLGKMLSGGGGLFGQPMYNRAGGGFTTPGGGIFGSNRGTSVVPSSTFNKPATTFNKPPMSSKSFSSSGSSWNGSQSAVKSQGGFGSSFKGGSSFGG